MQQFDVVYRKNYISSELCDFLVNHYCQWETAKVDKGDVNESSRISQTCWVKDEFWQKAFFAVMQDINQTSFEFDIYAIEALQVTKYAAPGGKYEWHQDSNGYTPHTDDLVRKVSMSIALNEDYEGGEFMYLNSHEQKEVPLKKGDMVVFPSYLLHTVKPVTKGTRYSLVAWASGGPLK